MEAQATTTTTTCTDCGEKMSKNDKVHHIAIHGGLAPHHACHDVHTDQVERALRDCRDYFRENKQTKLARLSLYAGAVKLLGMPLSHAHGTPSKWKREHGGSADGWTEHMKTLLRQHFHPEQPAPAPAQQPLTEAQEAQVRIIVQDEIAKTPTCQFCAHFGHRWQDCPVAVSLFS